MAKEVKVNLGERSYKIVIGAGLLSRIGDYLPLARNRQIVVITDYIVGKQYSGMVRKALKKYKPNVLQLPPGEKHKTLSAAAAIYDKLIDLNIHRDALVIALGGGVVGDLAGFIAATYMRGIDVVQVPTTLLAMVDAAIGGKTAVDHHKGKNLIGVFHQPKLVLIDINTIATLPSKEIKNGLAEVLKYGIIRDPKIFKMLEGNPKVSPQFWQKLVYLCARIKADVVSRDERETTGLRMILNLGHTVGHAVETLTGYKGFSHGEAVGYGMAVAATIARDLKLLDEAVYIRMIQLCAQLRLPLEINLKAESVIGAMKLDKKVKGGKLRLVLPVAIGKVTIRDNISEKNIRSALKELGCK
ncbi:MAG TPA: 3-dehydroquinate synthase [Candidatus Omnitrophota bacterium]|nr:3-dehydroquinate synthase [Candidatus Omnitrophota bacterium]